VEDLSEISPKRVSTAPASSNLTAPVLLLLLLLLLLLAYPPDPG